MHVSGQTWGIFFINACMAVVVFGQKDGLQKFLGKFGEILPNVEFGRNVGTTCLLFARMFAPFARVRAMLARRGEEAVGQRLVAPSTG